MRTKALIDLLRSTRAQICSKELKIAMKRQVDAECLIEFRLSGSPVAPSDFLTKAAP